MKFLLLHQEVELLRELESDILDPEYFDSETYFLNLSSFTLHYFIADLFEWIVLLNDKDERWILKHLGCRLAKVLA